MKKTATALVLIAPFATASAQTANVTLFGVADAALRSVRNDGLNSVNSMVSGSNATSRWGMRGSEDLGNGLNASFWLESGYAIDTGAIITNLFDRRATVSIGSRTMGELRLGRDFVPTYSNWSRFDPFSYVGAASSSNFVSATPLGPVRTAFGSNPNTTVRSSNAVQYLLPSGLGGIEGGLMYAPDEAGTAANGLHRVFGARIGYAAGSIVLSAAIANTENSLNPSVKFKDSVIAGSYDFGVVKISAAVREFKIVNARQTNLLVGLVAPIGPGDLKLSYNRADLKGSVGTINIGANDGSQFGVGYVYNLSKRSALYGTYSRITNKAAATFVVPGGATGLLGGKSSSGIEFGLRHTF